MWNRLSFVSIPLFAWVAFNVAGLLIHPKRLITLFPLFTLTAMGQRYGVLAQVYRTGDNYEYVAPPELAKSVINGDSASSAVYTCTNVRGQKSQSIRSQSIPSLYFELFNKLHEDICKKLIDDPLSAEIERKKDPKGLTTAETKIMLLASSGNTHQKTH